MAPMIMLECFVTGGRTIQAYKRGGKDEARERGIEESIGAVFWFGGVKGFNKMNDWIGQKILKLPHAEFDVGKDAVRNPLINFLKDHNGKFTKSQIAAFKFTKVASSILLANALVGFVVPKINQGITKHMHKFDNNNKPQEDKFMMSHADMNEFINNSQKKKNKNPSFGADMTQLFLSLGYKFENVAKYQLLSTDVGIAGGRAISARNNHERTEILFRDIASIYFYMFSMPNINRWLNQLEDGKKTRIDPVAAQQTHKAMSKLLDENGGKLSVKDFELKVLGDNNHEYKITETMSSKFKDGIIKLDEFLDISKKELKADEFNKFSDLAKRMSKLQPEIEGSAILTKNQVKDVFREGLINQPEFLDDVFGVATQGAHKKSYKFIAQSDLEGLKADVVDYVKDIVKKAKKSNKEVTADLLKKANRENILKNAGNWGAGFAISALFLSTFIPKIQYWITKVTTGQDSFPGTTTYNDEQKKHHAKKA